MVYAAWVFVIGWLVFIGHMVYLILLVAKEKRNLLEAMKEDVNKLEVRSINDILSMSENKEKEEEEEPQTPWWD